MLAVGAVGRIKWVPLTGQERSDRCDQEAYSPERDAFTGHAVPSVEVWFLRIGQRIVY